MLDYFSKMKPNKPDPCPCPRRPISLAYAGRFAAEAHTHARPSQLILRV